MSTEDSAVNEADEEPTLGKLTGCRDEKSIRKKQMHRSEKFGAEN